MTRFRVAVLVLSVALLGLSGCGGGSEAAEDGRAGYEPMPFAKFNKRIPRVQGLSSSPRDIAQYFLGLREHGYPEEPDLTIEQSIQDDHALIVVLAEGLADDSVRARRYRIELVRGDLGWRISWAGWVQRCHAQRGHQDFTREPCV
jgi:hypothetical protein